MEETRQKRPNGKKADQPYLAIQLDSNKSLWTAEEKWNEIACD